MKEKPAISIAKIYLAGFLAGAKFGTDKAIWTLYTLYIIRIIRIRSIISILYILGIRIMDKYLKAIDNIKSKFDYEYDQKALIVMLSLYEVAMLECMQGSLKYTELTNILNRMFDVFFPKKILQ